MLRHRVFYLLILFAVLAGCQQGVPEQAGGNSWELYRTLAYYKYVERDTAKYAAARFLIDNMPYHYSGARVCHDNDTLSRWLHETDSIYYSIVRGLRIDDFPWDTLRQVKKARRALMEADTLPDAVVDYRRLCDVSELSFEFLTDHIDNAFRVWRESPFAKNLTFDEFKEYILPYRSIEGYGFNETGKTYNTLFSKYVTADAAADLRTTVQYYNAAISNMRDMNGKTHRTQLSGIYDLYSRDFHACAEIASYGCNILRACGLPVVVEYNVCYRSLPGRHYHCCVYNDSTKEWSTFNAESSLPGDGDWAFAETANVYRVTFEAQKDTPPFLKAEGEYVPSVLDVPCIKDVTSHLASTTTITMPFTDTTRNNLAYLATFHKSDEGLMPVTWGVIDKGKRTVTFHNAMPGILYFPVYYPSREYQAFGKPFYIEMADSMPVMRRIPYVTDANDGVQSLLLTRKYPRKPSMRRVAEELVGARFTGANSDDFSDAVTLLEIKEAPAPILQTHAVKNAGSYKNYRFTTTAEHPHAHISMLEWLTPDSRGYANTMPACRPHILSPADTMLLHKESHLVRVMDADSWEDMSWKAEYDGNMQTAPSPYPDITLRLKEPQVVTHVRFSPKNADNGICAGDVYELRYWDGGWRSCDKLRAQYEYVKFPCVPKNKLYWLVNHSRGEEEMPFVVDDKGDVHFIYYDTINN